VRLVLAFRTLAPRLLALTLVIGAVSVVALDAHAEAPAAAAKVPSEPAPGERELLKRLVAPCCWNQTLDSHQGAAPDGFRAEIRSRLYAGETPAQIEADYVVRYGERVRAASHSRPLGWAAVIAGVAVIGAGAALVRMVLRWGKKSQALPENDKSKNDTAKPDALDERLDAELRSMD
jgi:cytochrome c-type biogenesis protein CcmH